MNEIHSIHKNVLSIRYNKTINTWCKNSGKKIEDVLEMHQILEMLCQCLSERFTAKLLNEQNFLYGCKCSFFKHSYEQHLKNQYCPQILRSCLVALVGKHYVSKISGRLLEFVQK